MPYVHLKTNVTKAKASPAEVNAALSKALSTALERPEEFIMTHAELGADMQFAKSDEPCAFVQVKTIGRVDETYNTKTVAELTTAVTTVLGVPSNRVFVLVSDVRNIDWAMDGKLLTWITA